MFKDITVSRRHFEVCDLFCLYVCMYVCMYVCILYLCVWVYWGDGNKFMYVEPVLLQQQCLEGCHSNIFILTFCTTSILQITNSNDGKFCIRDLGSAGGTFLRLPYGDKKQLHPGLLLTHYIRMLYKPTIFIYMHTYIYTYRDDSPTRKASVHGLFHRRCWFRLDRPVGQPNRST